jgi:hypothetical protein
MSQAVALQCEPCSLRELPRKLSHAAYSQVSIDCDTISRFGVLQHSFNEFIEAMRECLSGHSDCNSTPQIPTRRSVEHDLFTSQTQHPTLSQLRQALSITASQSSHTQTSPKLRYQHTPSSCSVLRSQQLHQVVVQLVTVTPVQCPWKMSWILILGSSLQSRV